MEYAFKDTKMTDEAYANVMAYLIVELGTVCWDKSDSSGCTIDTSSKMKRLEYAIYKWRDHLPATFHPWYIEFGENDAFSDVRYLTPWHCKSALGKTMKLH